MVLLIAALAIAAQTLQPQAAAPPPAPAPTNFSTAPVQPGSWRYAAAPGGSAASFVDATGTSRLVVQCQRATRQVSLSRISTTPAPSLQIWTDGAVRTLPARFEPNVFRVTVDLAASDRLLDAIAFSRGRIAVSMSGALPLVVPSWAEPARAIEDCRT
jgi:hypothetical protein